MIKAHFCRYEARHPLDREPQMGRLTPGYC